MRKKEMEQKEMKGGFTLVELSLSIAFIAILSITVTLIITNSIASYHRGLTLNSINTTGMDLVDDLRAAVQNAPARSPQSYCSALFKDVGENEALKACEADNGRNFVSVTRKARVKISGMNNNGEELPVFGAFCTGTYSYIWNSGYYFTDDSESKVEDIGRAVLLYNYFDEDNGETMNGKTETDFKLLKIRDRNREVCVAALNEGLTSPKDRRYTYVPDATNGDSINSVTEPNVFNLTNYSVISEEPVDLLAGDISNNLAIYDLTSAAPATNASMNSAFYITSFILGTIQGGININASGNFCATPEGYNSTIENFNYCAINKFNFAAQANGG